MVCIHIQLSLVCDGETVSTAESQQYEAHAAKVRKTKEKLIVISDFKIDVPPILGGLGEGKESTTPLTSTLTPGLWNSHYGVRGVHPKASKSLQDQILKLNMGINIELGCHMEARLMASDLLEKFCVFWSQLAAEIEAFQLHLVTTTYIIYLSNRPPCPPSILIIW